jgi:hypothetical protein
MKFRKNASVCYKRWNSVGSILISAIFNYFISNSSSISVFKTQCQIRKLNFVIKKRLGKMPKYLSLIISWKKEFILKMNSMLQSLKVYICWYKKNCSCKAQFWENSQWKMRFHGLRTLSWCFAFFGVFEAGTIQTKKNWDIIEYTEKFCIAQ